LEKVILMTKKERERLKVVEQIKQGNLTYAEGAVLWNATSMKVMKD
jgi:hypothetical protein